ncbi:hypothetical protein ELE36_09235 [Pseudolysobacter antarcticus]|uniref:Uncharacterized protein n=1 Tax=Pseudolysobacter antarcticus TaxID=2511995 RepID=A0A411HJ67_9GAMM|nr:hypothetical protein [Pseudolysobacter antarcticus]QBB70531.1 hypothetical protein ELE36_09235 [Pseudolysobacter antarcticus]
MQQQIRRISVIALVLAAYALGWAVTHVLSHPAPAWTALTDFCVTMPLIGAWFARRTPKLALRRALLLFGIGLLAARLLLPVETLPMFGAFANLRTFGMAILGLFEIGAVLAMLRMLVASRADENPELLIEANISKRFGAHPAAGIFKAEARMWLHLLSRRREWKFPGVMHFSYHRRDGMQSLLFGFIIVILLQIPFEHLLLSLWHPAAAWCISALSLYSVLWMIAHYRAVTRRPISLEDDRLIIRNGVFGDVAVPLNALARIAPLRASIDMHANRRVPGQRRIGSNGNLLIEFRQPLALASIIGSRNYNSLRFGADTPQRLVDAVNARLVQINALT